MASAPGGATLCSGGTVTASGTVGGGYAAANAFDGNPSSIWASAVSPPSDQWIQYAFATAVSVAEVRLTVRGDGYLNQAPHAFDVQGSNDGVTFATVQSFPAPTWAVGQTQAFAIASSYSGTTNALVSQSRLEILGASRPGVTVAQSSLEVLGRTRPAALVSQSFVEVLFRPSSNTPGPRPRRVFVAMT